MNNTYNFEISQDIPWSEIEHTYDSNVYKTHSWFNHLGESCNVKPFVVTILNNNQVIGWLVAGKIKRFGLNVIASPFEGWATSYQGLSLINKITKEERINIIIQIKLFLFKKCNIHFFQLSDWEIDYDDISGLNIHTEPINSYLLDISTSIEELFKSFKQKSCQYCIHKAQKQGVIIKEPDDLSIFGHEYYKQLEDVFIKQNLKPTYGENRVQSLLHSMNKNKELIVLEALHPETKKCMACIIFLLHNGIGFYWGASSWREYQKYCPNELLMFEGIKVLKNRGCVELEMEGIRAYKEKYNPIKYSKPKIVFAKYKIIIILKNYAKKMYYGLRDLMAFFRK